MGYSFTDLGAEGCCRSLNALFVYIAIVFYWINMKQFSKLTGTALRSVENMGPQGLYCQVLFGPS